MSQANPKDNNETFKFPSLHAIPNNINKDADNTEGMASELEMDGVEMSDEIDDKKSNSVEQNTEQSKPVNQALHEEVQKERSGENETEKNQVADEQPPAKSKKKKSKSPLISKITKIIKRIFVGGVFLIGVGSSYIWADKNGYVSMVMNTFKSEEVTSEIDIKQNEMITKFQLVTSDLKKEIEEIKSFNSTELENTHGIQNKLQSQVASLKSEYENYKTLSQRMIVNNKSKSENNSEDIEQLKTTSLRSINDTSENKILIDTLQKEIDRVVGKVNTVNAKTNKIQRKINSAPKVVKQPVVAQEKPKVVAPKGPKQIYSYSGLTISQVFNWSTQKIAVLSDSAGTSIQVSKGNKLGNATITDVSSNYILIKDDLTSAISKLIKQG